MDKIEIHKIYKRKKSDRDLFQALMPHKMREILLISTYYDAYIIEGDEQFTDKIVGEYLQVNLYTAPHFTFVASEEEAEEVVQRKHIDLIIFMAGLDKEQPIRLSRNLKELFPLIPQILLVNNNSDLGYFKRMARVLAPSIERTFVWNGSTNIFLAMAKYMEDKLNVDQDTELGDIGVFLLVEDSITYYSKYLPILYSEVVNQTQNVIKSEPRNKEMSVVMKIRIRPKVLLATTYESAVTLINKYRSNIMGVISDVSYMKNGKKYDHAGADLIRYVHGLDAGIPCLLQSMEEENKRLADEVSAAFCNKNSPTLQMDIKDFINRECGFGDFVFRNMAGEEIARAVSIEDFKRKWKTLPRESIYYHALRNDFSAWFMARGEMRMAKLLRRHKTKTLDQAEVLRSFFQKLYASVEIRELKGQILLFNENYINSNHYITRIGQGSLGGKGRGLAFLCNFIENTDLRKLIPGLSVVIPKTTVLAVEEYTEFVESNHLSHLIYENAPYQEICDAFIAGKMPDELHAILRKYVEIMKKPLAVRSSGMFEDSLNLPYAGVYSSYMIPNNNRDIEVRLRELETAVKLVWCSIYTDSAKAYSKAIGSVIEDEKMAVILQEVVGNEHNGRYYPNISGVAQSYNFYPFSYIRPKDGFAVMAMGLGAYVVGGEKTYRFCPVYPKLENFSLNDALRDTQRYFYGIDMEGKAFDYVKDGELAAISKYYISDAEKDGTLTNCASVYNYRNMSLSFDFDEEGPRIVDFSGILKYEALPLARALMVLLDIFQQAMGAPVEIEFALDKDEGVWKFYLLQIKPLMKTEYNTSIDEGAIPADQILLRAEKGMGNGTLEDLTDILYVDLDRFDKFKTREIAEEVRNFNNRMTDEGKKFVLIGPGRWGTRDPMTGIPVLWSDISNAKVIVEQGLKGFPLDASLGSHFFHNVTSMNVGYFAIPNRTDKTFISYEKLSGLPNEEVGRYLRHVRTEKPFTVIMDGRKQISVIRIG